MTRVAISVPAMEAATPIRATWSAGKSATAVTDEPAMGSATAHSTAPAASLPPQRYREQGRT